MRKKKPDIYEQQKQRRWEAYSQAPLIKDRFPILASLSMHMTFEEPDWGGNPSPKQETFGPKSKAFFEIECPYYECISGGFNLSSAVIKLVNTRGTESSGTIICQGWQDRERINKHRCLLKMKYKITATYLKV
jgi:hypothetical protein